MAVGTALEEVGPYRGLDEVHKPAQDPVVVEAGDLGERGLDAGAYPGLSGGPVSDECRIEPGAEQGDDVPRDPGMPAQRTGEIVLSVPDAQLTQVATERPEEGGLPPEEGGFEDEAVVAIGFRGSVGDGEHRSLERPFQGVEIDRDTGGALDQHVVQPDSGAVFDPCRHDPIGALVDDAEAEILQAGHPVGQGDGGAPREDLQPDLRGRVALSAAELHGPRLAVAEALEDRHVGDCDLRLEIVPVGGRERVAVAGGQHARLVAAVSLRERLAQCVAPGPDQGGDAGFEGRWVLLRAARVGQADDVVDPGEGALRIVRVGGTQPAAIGLGEVGADPASYRRIVAVLRNVDEERHEAAEPVRAREHAHSRPVGQSCDGQGEPVEPLDVDLEQIVARIALQYREEASPSMARRVETGALDHRLHLPAQDRNLAGGAGIGRRCEQADDPHLTGQLPEPGEELDAHIVQEGRAVDAGFHTRLRDDEGLRLLQEGEDFGGVVHGDPAPAQGRGAGIAQHAEARPLDQGMPLTVDTVLLHAEEQELALCQPLQKSACFLGLAFGHRRRGAAEIRREFRNARQHGVVIVGRQSDVPVDRREGVQQPLAGLGRQPVEVDVDEALARQAALGIGRRFADDPYQTAAAIPLDAENRVRDEVRGQALLGQFGEGRVEEEGPVVVDDFEDRHLARPATADEGTLAEAQPCRFTGPARLSQEGTGARGEIGESHRVVGGQILRCHAAEQVAHEAARSALLGHDVGGRLDQSRPGRLLL